MITIRNYSVEDAKALWDIHFYTIRNINIRDYSQAQVEAWAPERLDPSVWEKRMKGLSPFVAEIDGVIVGYTDLQASGLIDHFFCHHEHQGKGVGKALMNHVFKVGNSRGIKRYFSEVSITARPFYEHFGFKVVQAQEMEVRGQKLRNFVMEKYS
ncbi:MULTISPECIES: GNAT family N-acetyltransferase [Vibrio harveyi group]|uniref:GNAT family N-acetyltransferase n=1 Tax=Vibrio harveyi group TaxID=717610 RepID=UPI00111F44D4|nr:MULTISPECIES: GNAT family N-acetyltransferase [Vibrio harveyi group]EHH1101707.1 GNAT family N-acetyltransferase [Vibrio parahaemolyticus]EJE8156002.1 GNAT family N-acetyltransferase [Vibrio alginolyticus]EJL6746663.1 GNAT family N-acetyltransferase [Vibrio alginolyticus]ELA9085366.1 GNAT family N-acetyltransferase [Vibrio alginolyticus]ELB2938002.1 GNAT family N-acetyltransferase [Vibrio alginolyticus]